MQKSKDLLFQLEAIVKNKGIINYEVINFLDNVFSKKSKKVMEAIKRGISKKVCKPTGRIIWIATGKDVNHIIYPKLYCSCQDFYKNVVVKREKSFCKHILAQVISEALKDFEMDYCEEKQLDELIEKIESNF